MTKKPHNATEMRTPSSIHGRIVPADGMVRDELHGIPCLLLVVTVLFCHWKLQVYESCASPSLTSKTNVSSTGIQKILMNDANYFVQRTCLGSTIELKQVSLLDNIQVPFFRSVYNL